MTEQETVLLNQFSASMPVPLARQDGASALDILVILLRRKKMIGIVAPLTAIGVSAAMLLLPPSYLSQTTILPPQQAQSSMAALASGAMGGLASSMGPQLGLKNPADLYIGILKSRTIADEIISEFQLQKVYGKKLLSAARKKLSSEATFASSKESLITISVTDRDPQRATAMANAFVDALYKQNSRLALTNAAQKRLFFEQQLAKEKEELAKAELDLKATQQSTGLLVPSGQAEVLIRSGAQLRAQIAASEVQLQAMRAYATEENPEVQTLKREISTLQALLARGEAKGNPDSKLEISGDRLPQVSLEYVRKLREVKYHETLFELIAKQYEAARLDEAKDAPIIQVVDRATVPDKDERLPWLAVICASAAIGLLLAAILALMTERIQPLAAAWNGIKANAEFHSVQS